MAGGCRSRAVVVVAAAAAAAASPPLLLSVVAAAAAAPLPGRSVRALRAAINTTAMVAVVVMVVSDQMRSVPVARDHLHHH